MSAAVEEALADNMAADGNECKEVNNNEDAKEAQQTSSTSSGPSEWLCVSRLPLDLEEGELRALLSEYGAVEQIRMIRSESTGG